MFNSKKTWIWTLIVAAGIAFSSESFATRKDRRPRPDWAKKPTTQSIPSSPSHDSPTATPPSSAASTAANENTSEVTRYLTQVLKVENPADFNLTLKLEKRLAQISENMKGATPDTTPFFSEQSAPVLGAIFRALGRTQYNNVMVLGQAGVGKSHLLDQLTLLFSQGVYPDFLKQELGIHGENEAGSEAFQLLRDAFLGKLDLVLINVSLLSHDNTRAGKAFSTETVRMSTTLNGLFNAARAEFQRTDKNGARTGRRTLFVLDEVATLPEIVQASLKKILDESGFKNPKDPIFASKDSGYMVLGMTTFDEFRAMVLGDSAIERRYVKVPLKEPTEKEALRILRVQSDLEWTPLYGLEITDEALRYVIQMRRFIDTPPLAMPNSVLAATNDLFLAAMTEYPPVSKIDQPQARKFLKNKLGLTDMWFEGPNGEPPFTGFAEEVKKRVIGQDAVIDTITDRIAAWARLGFGGDLPVFFLGGPSGSGKDTLLKALNEVMFGHEGKHLVSSIGGIGGYGIESIIEGPPLGNHSDGSQGLLIKALENGPSTGIIAFNEGKDAPTPELEKLKVFIESGEIRPKGRDSRVRPLKFPIFIMGQWGEELFEGQTDAQIAKTYGNLTQSEIEQTFLAGKDPAGKDSGKIGAVSRALLDRAKKTGGVFLLKPVAQKHYPEVVKIHVASTYKRLKSTYDLKIEVSPALIQFITEVAIEAHEGLRAMDATTIDFTETAISKATGKGLRTRSGSLVRLDYQNGQIVVSSEGHTSQINAAELRRIKLCEYVISGE